MAVSLVILLLRPVCDRLSDMSLVQACDDPRSADYPTLHYDFVIEDSVYDNDKIQIGVFIKSAMNNRAISEKGVNLRIRLKA